MKYSGRIDDSNGCVNTLRQPPKSVIKNAGSTVHRRFGARNSRQ